MDKKAWLWKLRDGLVARHKALRWDQSGYVGEIAAKGRARIERAVARVDRWLAA